MRKYLLSILMAFVMPLVSAQTLVVCQTDGSEIRIALSSQPKISYDETAMMRIAGESLDIEIPLGQVRSYKFDLGSGVADVENTSEEYGDHMIDMNGRIVPLTWDRPGVYLVKINGRYVKCIKR